MGPEEADESALAMGSGMSAALEAAVRDLASRIEMDGDTESSTAAQRLRILEQLMEFSLGRFLITRGRLGAEEHLMVSTWPATKASASPASTAALASSLKPLERFLLDESPTMRAFQKRHQAMLGLVPELAAGKAAEDGSPPTKQVGAIVPGCLLEDLTELSPTDADAAAAGLSRLFHVHIGAHGRGLSQPIADAAAGRLASTPFGPLAEAVTAKRWDTAKLPLPADFLVTGTLTMNEPDVECPTALYSHLHSMMRPGGILTTGFLTNTSNADPDVVQADRVIFREVIRCRWSHGRDPDTVVQQLLDAGFSDVDILHQNGSYGTAVARA